jgi:hypothetical protein
MWVAVVGDALLGAGMAAVVLAKAPDARSAVEFVILIAPVVGAGLLFWYLVSRRWATRSGGSSPIVGRSAFVAGVHLIAFSAGLLVGTGEMPPRPLRPPSYLEVRRLLADSGWPRPGRLALAHNDVMVGLRSVRPRH